MMKLSDKAISAVVSVAVAAGTIGAAAAVSNGIVAQKATSSAAISNTTVSSAPAISLSTVESSTAPVSSSKGTVSTVADGIDAIQKATDEGVNKIHEETSKAVSKVQATAPSSQISHTLTATGRILITKKEKGVLKGDPDRIIKEDLEIGQRRRPNEADGFVAFGYGGHYDDDSLNTVDGLKQAGFKLLNAKGEEIPFTDYKGMTWIKVPFTRLSDISTMYLTYKDQKITITIS